jgi:hypothetical protein
MDLSWRRRHRIVHVVNRFPESRLCQPLAAPDGAARALARLCETPGRGTCPVSVARTPGDTGLVLLVGARMAMAGNATLDPGLVPRALAEADPLGAAFGGSCLVRALVWSDGGGVRFLRAASCRPCPAKNAGPSAGLHCWRPFRRCRGSQDPHTRPQSTPLPRPQHRSLQAPTEKTAGRHVAARIQLAPDTRCRRSRQSSLGQLQRKPRLALPAARA